MSGGTFAKCPGCGRLNLYGQVCVCAPATERHSRCDCTYNGNTQHIGAECSRRLREVWADAIRRSREISRRIVGQR